MNRDNVTLQGHFAGKIPTRLRERDNMDTGTPVSARPNQHAVFSLWRSCPVSVAQPVEPGLDHGNFRIDLVDEQTEIEAHLSLQKDRQLLPVRPEISERVPVIHLDIRVHDLFNCVRHGFPVSSRWVQMQRYDQLCRARPVPVVLAGALIA
jgi:hypothetical protein